jgi:hypothetical protein
MKSETIKISFDAISKIDPKDMRHGVSKQNLATITEHITNFFFPPDDLLPEDYRMLSAGKTIHEHLITSYQKIWKYRCSNNSALSMDFRSRLATFPRGLHVHELNEDDYANNVKISSAYGVESTRSKRKQALRNQVTFSSSDPATMAPPDNLNNQSKVQSAISISKINNKTDFQSKKQRLSDLRKEKLSKPKPAKVTTFLPESQPSLSKLQKMETAYFALFLRHRVLMIPAI